MFVITDPPMNYGLRWKTIGVICSYRPENVLEKLLHEARKLVPPFCRLEILEVSTQAAHIAAIYIPSPKIVVAQIETIWQDGCVPPVHVVLASANPIPTKYHGSN